jgi:hypothetical protein
VAIGRALVARADGVAGFEQMVHQDRAAEL